MRIGSLFAGYGGLDMGVQAALGGDVVWHSEIDKGACKILDHRYPDVPNLGDITAVDWSQVEPVDVITGGFPCQDVSHAGERAGLRPDTRTGLWSQMAYAIDQLRPALVVAENVRGLLSAEAHSDLEPCPWCLGDGSSGAPLRALGAVLGDLADLGYDASWYGLRAADVGAPHGRFRVFVVAYPHDGAQHGERSRPLPGRRGAAAADTGRLLGRTGWPAGPREAQGGRSLSDAAGRDLLPTPRAVNDMGASYTPDEWDAWTEEAQRLLLPTPMTSYSQRDPEKWLDQRPAGNGQRRTVISDLEIVAKSSLSVEAQRLLPTPRTANNENRQSEGYAGEDGNFYGLLHNPERWGQYADAIARWETVLGRPAPAPTMTSSKGNPQLAPAFVEWMMGLAAGWITDVPGITRNEALKALGNGVVPQQAAAAMRLLLPLIEVAA